MLNYQTHESTHDLSNRNDPFDIVSEGPTKQKERFKLIEMSTECSWHLDLVIAECANKYMENVVSNQTLINKIVSVNHVIETFKKGKILDLYLKELLAGQDIYIFF